MIVVIEAGVVAGYVIAWAVRKARRVAGRLDSEADGVIDASLDRLHEVVAGKLGSHPALAELVGEAEGTASGGEVSDLTRQQVELALTAAAVKDDAFGKAVTELVRRVREAERATGSPVIAGPGSAVFSGNARVKAEDGGIAFGQVAGGGAHQPGAAGPYQAGAARPLTSPGILPGTGPLWPASGAVGIGSARDVNVFQAPLAAVARSAYLEQVRRIAPPDPPGLIGRDGELAELARFCLDPGGAPYAWWRAGPWTGKSALLSTFVLRPPAEVAEQVRLVSFFITARLAAQDTREAFIDVLLEQLAALLGRSLPAILPEATREAYLLDLMSQASAACWERGGRLVLVVDGLDEDRGVTTGTDAHSIAGLLPAAPPTGMRVIVAGRPNPPIPDDVPGWHPLRDPAIIRSLAPSRYAQDVQRLARQELKRLLHGSTAERNLLGLVTAARGGLTARDLAELAGIPQWEVEDILLTAAGRTFRSRPSRYDIGTKPDLHLLAHEELQASATAYLGPDLDGYRERLHAWADGYRARGWPSETPEYLLAGYFRLLEEITDLPRMTTCALDSARHDRMLDVTGGDVAALAEARAVLDHIAAQDDPDLASALALACHRDHLADRNAQMPGTLPTVWAALGQVPRAEALARTITKQGSLALTELAQALASAGQYQRAEDVARTITNPDSQADTLAKVAEALARAGQQQQAADLATQAEDLAHTITNPASQAITLVRVAQTLASAGQYQRAENVARTITSPEYQADALAKVAEALARAGQYQRAADLATHAEDLAHTITESASRARALARVAQALDWGEQRQHAADLVTQAEDLVRSIASSGWHEDVKYRVAAALASTGQYRRAEAMARSITDPEYQPEILADIAEMLARAGQHQQAVALAALAESRAWMIEDEDWQSGALTGVAGTFALVGQHQRAEDVAHSITDPGYQARALAHVAAALASTGQHESAAAIAAQAEDVARTINPASQADALARVALALARAGQHQQAAAIAAQAEDLAHTIPDTRADTLAKVAEALALAGQYQQAANVASSITDPGTRARALAQVAEALARAGQHQQAADVAAQAEDLARTITGSYRQDDVLASAAVAFALAGQYQRAEDVARSINNNPGALAKVAQALARAGQHQQAADLAAQAEDLARTITNLASQASPLPQIAEALALAGQYQQAANVASSITDPGTRARALAQVAEALARAGQHQQAADVAAQAEDLARTITGSYRQDDVLASAAVAFALAGQYQRAEDVARSITYPFSGVARVAETLAHVGETRTAARVTAALCAAEGWPTALTPVFLLMPSAFSKLVRTLGEQ